MTDILKTIISPKQKPITSEDARLLSITGKLESLDKRISDFIKDLNNIITNKARNNKSYCLVELTPDLLDSKDNIINDIKERGFNIHELNPKIESVFIVSWIVNSTLQKS